MTRKHWVGLGAIVLGWAIVYWWLMNRDRAGGQSAFHDPSGGIWA